MTLANIWRVVVNLLINISPLNISLHYACFYLKDFITIVMLLLAAVSINGLSIFLTI